MSIESVDVNITSPGRNFVTLKIVTTDGVVGWGDGTLNGRELSVAAYLSEHVASTLIGRDEDRIEDTWQYLYRAPYWRRGPVTMAAIAAVDMALWDIKAKKAGVPLYQLLGGASRDGIRIYAHASGPDYAALKDAIAAYVDAGFTAVRVQTGVPGLGQIYGVHTTRPGEKYNYEPAHRAADGSSAVAPIEETWDTPRVPGPHARGLREASGRTSARACGSCTTAITACRRSRRRGSRRTSSRTACSGWRTARPVKTRRRCGWCGSTRPRRSPSARSSTPCSTTRRSSPSG